MELFCVKKNFLKISSHPHPLPHPTPPSPSPPPSPPQKKQLNKTSLGETGRLSNLCYLLAAQASRIHFQNCSLKIHIRKLLSFKTLSLIYSLSESSESSEELSKKSITCLTTFFSMYLNSFKKTHCTKN